MTCKKRLNIGGHFVYSRIKLKKAQVYFIEKKEGGIREHAAIPQENGETEKRVAEITRNGGSTMKKIFTALLIVFVMMSFSCAKESPDVKRGTAEEAKALLSKAVAFYKANGQEKAFAAFNDPKGQFVSKDLYIFAFDMDRKVIAHGADPDLINKDLMKVPDADGNYFMNTMVNVAKTQGKGVVDYKWKNPATGKIEPKSTYVEKVADNVALACGNYELFDTKGGGEVKRFSK